MPLLLILLLLLRAPLPPYVIYYALKFGFLRLGTCKRCQTLLLLLHNNLRCCCSPETALGLNMILRVNRQAGDNILLTDSCVPMLPAWHVGDIAELPYQTRPNVQGDTSNHTLAFVDNDFTTSTVCPILFGQ